MALAGLLDLLVRAGIYILAVLPCDLIPLAAGCSLRVWSQWQLVRLLRLWWVPAGCNAVAWLLRYRSFMSVGRARILSCLPCFLLAVHLIACTWQVAGAARGEGGGWQAVDRVLVSGGRVSAPQKTTKTSE